MFRLSTTAFALLLASSSFAQLPASKGKSLEEHTEAVIKAEEVSYSGMSHAYRNLFAAAAVNDQLIPLRRHENTSIAMQAAWQNVLGTLTKKQLSENRKPTDKLALGRFLGLIEGRTRTAIPRWWADFVVEGPESAEPDWYHNAGQEFVFAPRDTKITKDGAAYTLHISNDNLKLPNSILDEDVLLDGNLWCRFSGLFTEKHCFVAVHDDVGYGHLVACVDRNTGKLVWTSDACGGYMGMASGRHESWVSVTLQDGQVVIFGASWTGFYLHAFDAVSGESRFLFSTAFASYQ